MSTAEPNAAEGPQLLRIEAHTAILGEGMRIARALPTTRRRLVGAWCFLDHFGPANVAEGGGMRVGPHPHIGLQTVTWLLEGEILHRDSLGSLQLIRPGQLNLMSAGRGICHSEESPEMLRPAGLHGAQLWIAQPEDTRRGPPAFAHYPELPVVQHGNLCITVLVGTALGERSPAWVATPLVGLELRSLDAFEERLPLDPGFEYAALVLQGTAEIDGEFLGPRTLLYLGRGRESLRLRSEAAACVLLIGGEPFAEDLLMWWNFVGRSQEELTTACRDWNREAAYFGAVKDYDGRRLIAPLPPWAIHGA